jgi:outer membrane protein insertion porin family
MKRITLLSLFFIFFVNAALAQYGIRIPQEGEFSYLAPRDYVIGGVKVTGTKHLDNETIITISKLVVGRTIEVPSEATSDVVKILMSQGLFDDVELYAERIVSDTIYFNIVVVEQPRLAKTEIIGLNKTQTEEVTKRLATETGKIVNQNLFNTTKITIERYLAEKHFLYPTIVMKTRPDSSRVNYEILTVHVDRNRKVAADHINFEGNVEFTDAQMRKMFKGVKQRMWFRIFGPGIFKQEKYKEAKQNLIAKMQDKGFRDAEILFDTVYQIDHRSVGIDIKVHEGPKYYVGNITFQGNARFSDSTLFQLLGIEKGDVFSEEKLVTKLMGPTRSNDDISSLYMNDGYLAFNVDPVQSRIYGDTVDIDIRIYEGAQYTVRNILLKGNDVTNDRVLLRSIHTKPGQKFSKELLMRSVREISQLGNFDEQKTAPNPLPNHADNTVDIEYSVVEKPSDQVELSGGFGANQIIGTLGLSFNNFSTHNLFKKDSWKPLPRGDGQKLSVRGQTSGKRYQSYSLSFTEPWLGGKKPIYFGVNAFTSHSAYGGHDLWTGKVIRPESEWSRIWMNGVAVSLGKRLQWPDNWFQLNYSAGFNQYKLQNYGGYFLFDNGTSYNINLTQELSRNSVDAPIYPRSGSHLRLTIQLTPPYSLFNNINYPTAPDNERYKWTEYHKWKFDSQWYIRIAGNLVLKTQAQFGFLGSYSSATGTSAFERFKLGGDGMMGFDFLQGSEIIAMRGYANGYLIPENTNRDFIQQARNSGSPIYTKYQFELRHPIMLNEQATIFMMAFAEGGNTWNHFRDYNPFKVRRSVGVGARIFLPIFGMLGIDYGHAFDPIPGVPKSQWKQGFSFSIMQQMGGF